MKSKILAAVFYLSLLTSAATAQTNLSQVPNLLVSNNWADRAALYLGAPGGSELDVAAGGTYVPSFHSGQKLGWWVAATFETSSNSLLAYEIGTQDLEITKGQNTTFLPNGLVLIRHSWYAGPIAITPLIEAGGAVDDKFTQLYGIAGAGLDVGWKGFSVLAGAERWTGARNSFTVVKAGVAYSITF